MLEMRLPSVVSVWMNRAYCCRKQPSRDEEPCGWRREFDNHVVFLVVVLCCKGRFVGGGSLQATSASPAVGTVVIKAETYSGDGDGEVLHPALGEVLTQTICLPRKCSDYSPSEERDDERMNEIDARTQGVGSVPNESLPSRQSATGAYPWDKAS